MNSRGQQITDLKINLEALGVFAAIEEAKKSKQTTVYVGGGTGEGGGGGNHPGIWGNITGTLSNQTDLQNALDAKYDASNPANYISDISGFSTTNLAEGTNLYFTNERAQDAVGNALVDSSTIDFTYNDAANTITASVITSGIDHGGLAGLTDDDHTQYALLAGRSGGQTIYGGTGAGDGLTIHSTSNATKGTVSLASQLYVDSANQKVNIGTTSPYKNARFFVQDDYTGTTDRYGQFLGLTWTASANNSAFVGGLGFVVETEGNKSYLSQVKGFDGQVIHNGTADINQILGGNFITQIINIGTATAAFAINTAVAVTNAAASLQIGVNYQAGPPTATGTIANMIGMWVFNQGATNVGLAASLYLADTSGSGTNYGILAVGGNHVWNAGQTSGDFTIMGATDTALFFVYASADKIGIGTNAPKNKLDIEGALAVGASYSGTSTAPSNGILSQGTIAVATTSFTTPGATSTTWGFITKADGATGGLYYRAIQTADSQLTMGAYHLLSGRAAGTITGTGTQIIGTQNELYPATEGTSITQNIQAYGEYNFVQADAQAAYAQVYGANTIVLSDADSGQTFGHVVIMQVSGTGTTDSAYFTHIVNSGTSETRTTGAYGALMNISSVNETAYGLNIDTTDQATINDPTVMQAAIALNWNIPGTDANNMKFGVFVNATSNNSAKSFFGDKVGIGTEVAATMLQVSETVTLSAGLSDGYSGTITISPEYTGAFTVTRHDYIDINQPSLLSSAAVTDAAVMRFNAAAGTHKAVDSSTTKSTPGSVDAWVKINVNGTIMFMPAYTSKTA
jgi:hypothetical protein